MSRYNIDVRLAQLGKKHVEVVRTLIGMGHKLTPSEFSGFKRGYTVTPKAELVLSEADKIISKWEREQRGKAV